MLRLRHRRILLLLLLLSLLLIASSAFVSLLSLGMYSLFSCTGDELLQLAADTGVSPLPSVCGHSGCSRAFIEKYTQPRRYSIPPIRHILWKDRRISKYFAQQLGTWQRIHPNWTYVLWRDADLDPFVRKYFPGKVWQKFKSLPTEGRFGIERVDMFRYLLMYKFGGVYADLDYSLVDSLDRYRRFTAVVTREPEAHAAQFLGMWQWPLPIVGNAAFFMSAPGHSFFRFCVEQLVHRCESQFLSFAGPFGLSTMLKQFHDLHNTMLHPDEFVYIPPSYSFYPYEGNRLDTSRSRFRAQRVHDLKSGCFFTKFSRHSLPPAMQQYCKDVNNMDPITDSSQPIVAVHDLHKKMPVYLDENGKEFTADLQDLKSVLPNVKLGCAII